MPQNAQTGGPRLMPSLRYRDVEAAIEWLADAFGFEEHDVATEADGTIRHVQLTLGSDMIMLLPDASAATDGCGQQRAEIGDADAHSLYFVVDDVEEHYRRAMAAGADILENGEFAFGGHGYSCRDPEGHIWHFGTFNPHRQATGDGAWIGEFLHGGRARSLAIRLHDRLNPAVLVATGAAVVAAATMGLLFLALPHTSASPRERGLAFRALIASQTEQAGVDTPARANRSLQITAPRIEPAWPALRAERASSDASRPPADDMAREESSAPAPAEAPQRNDQASNEDADRSARQTVEQVLDKVRTARQAADEAGEETLGRLHTAQQVTSSPPEAPDQATIPTPDVREQQIARELIRQELARKPGTAQKAAEPTGKEAPNWQVETKRTKPAPAQAANAPAQRSQVTNTGTQGPRDCAPSQPTGQIVCRPPGKKGSPAKASASAQAKQQRVAAEAAAERSPKQQQIDLQQQSDRIVAGQLWDCQPSPPKGDVVCHPINGGGRTTR